MEDAGPRAVRWFVGLSLVVGGFALLGGALQYGSFSGAPYWVVAFAAALASLLSLFAASLEPGRRGPPWPAAARTVGVYRSLCWARLGARCPPFLRGRVVLGACGCGRV